MAAGGPFRSGSSGGGELGQPWAAGLERDEQLPLHTRLHLCGLGKRPAHWPLEPGPPCPGHPTHCQPKCPAGPAREHSAPAPAWEGSSVHLPAPHGVGLSTEREGQLALPGPGPASVPGPPSADTCRGLVSRAWDICSRSGRDLAGPALQAWRGTPVSWVESLCLRLALS